MEQQINILLVEDNRGDYILTREMLADIEQAVANKGTTFQLVWAERLTAGLQQIGKQRFDVILLDLSLPDAHGLDGFYILRAVAVNVPILVLTGYDDQNAALNAVQAGAQDYLVKGKLDSNVFGRAIRYAIERHQILRDLESAKESAERANRAKSEFLSTMSDEMTVPLKNIMRTAKSMLDGPLPVEHRESLEQVKSVSHGLFKLVNNIVDFTRIESGNLTVRPVSFKLREFFSQVAAMLELQAKEKGTQLCWEIGADVPNSLRGDSERLGQVITNLVENAIKFCRSESSTNRIDIRCDVNSQLDDQVGLHFSVAALDTGIPLEEQQLIFESFAQADVSTLRKYGSTGLGLAVSSKLVELMGGRAWVKSESGRGTSFHFTARYTREKVESAEKVLAA